MTYNADWLRESPFWTLDDAIDTAASEFPGEWKRFWGIGEDHAPDDIDPDLWETANQMHEMARRICAVAGALQGGLPEHIRTLPALLDQEQRSERKSRSDIAKLLKEQMLPEQRDMPEWKELIHWLEYEAGPVEAKAKLFNTAVQIYSYNQFGSSPGQIGRRLLALLEYLVRASGERTREYLSRVATCYVREMDPEMAVMSRAVMESALQIPVIDERVEEVIRVKGKRHPGLIDWIDAASDLGVLDESGRAAADLVKNAGDDAVHNIPQSIPDSDVILRNLSRVLGQIEQYRKRKDR